MMSSKNQSGRGNGLGTGEAPKLIFAFIMLCTVPSSVCCGSTECVSQSNETVTTVLHLGANSADVDTLTQHIASVPWGTMRAFEAANTNEADLIITVSYEKKDVVFDKDVIPVKISDKSFPDNHLMIHRVKCRDNWSQDNWCRGAANLTKVDEAGFVINLGLSWGGVPQGNFNEKFNCSWKSRQEFLKDGFRITVETIKHGTEEKRAR